MEKVKVVKAIPGILSVGDVLISPVEGADFCLEETKVTKNGSSERFVSLDYVTVSENIPQFFVFEFDEAEDVVEYEEEIINKCKGCKDCKCLVKRTDDEILARYDFFRKGFNESAPGSEEEVVYRNLMWFIEWLSGDAEIL